METRTLVNKWWFLRNCYPFTNLTIFLFWFSSNCRCLLLASNWSPPLPCNIYTQRWSGGNIRALPSSHEFFWDECCLGNTDTLRSCVSPKKSPQKFFSVINSSKLIDPKPAVLLKQHSLRRAYRKPFERVWMTGITRPESSFHNKANIHNVYYGT